MLTKLILAGVLVLGVAAAQPGGGMGGGMGGSKGGGGGMDRGEGGGMGGGGGMSRPSSRLEMWSEMLKLNKDQKKQLKTVMDDGQKEATPVKEEMTKARLAIAEGVASGSKGDDLKKPEMEYAAAAAHMNQIELGAFAKIYQMLDKDQQAKAGQLFAMVSGVFHGKNWNDLN